MSLADKVAAEINRLALEIKFSCKRRLFPIEDTKKLASTQVSVFDGPKTSDREARGEWARTQMVFVAVQRKIDVSNEGTQTKEADDLMGLMASIETHFEDRDLLIDGHSLSGFDETTQRLPFSSEMLHGAGVFAAVVGLDFERL